MGVSVVRRKTEHKMNLPVPDYVIEIAEKICGCFYKMRVLAWCGSEDPPSQQQKAPDDAVTGLGSSTVAKH
jgi:hypothetical protein